MGRKKSNAKSINLPGKLPSKILQLSPTLGSVLLKTLDTVTQHPFYKKYKRITASPLGRIARDVLCCFFLVVLLIRGPSSPRVLKFSRNMMGVGALQYNKYAVNITIASDTDTKKGVSPDASKYFRSVIGELEGAKKSSEAVVLVATGMKGADAWNETGVMQKIVASGYRAIALDPPGLGQGTIGYEEPTARVMLKDMGIYMRNVINLLGPRKVVLVVADRMVSFGLALLKEYPHMVTGVCFVTPQIQQDRDPLVIRKYAEWMDKLRVPAISLYPKTDKDALDSKMVLDHIKGISYQDVKYVGKLWFFEHHEDFEELFIDWLVRL